MHKHSGFSLVETLVVGIIGSIVAGMFIAFMYVHNDAIDRGVAHNILLTQSEIVSTVISQTVRQSNGVFGSNETWDSNPQLQERQTDTIVCYAQDGTVIAVFRFGQFSQRLYEGTSFDSLEPLKSGKDTVVTLQGSRFILSADRKRVTLDISYTIKYRRITDTLPSKRDSYLCRN